MKWNATSSIQCTVSLCRIEVLVLTVAFKTVINVQVNGKTRKNRIKYAFALGHRRSRKGQKKAWPKRFSSMEGNELPCSVFASLPFVVPNSGIS